ncbi:MAG: tRNA lysidine(34) synthetase TilS [Mycobacterium leprae]
MGPSPAVAAVRVAVRRALTDVPRGSLVAVAASGGADSLALAAGLAFVAPRAGLRAGALTVDHRLQPASGALAARTAAALTGLGLAPVEVLPVTVQPGGRGPEAAAREARYAALDAAADRLGVNVVLLGHTRDDQAETVLLGLARGSGPRSLAGMPAVAGRYRRPLLELPRTATRAACAAQRLTPHEDPHNADPAYARVRLRTVALPALEAAVGPGVAAALARTAAQLRDDADALDAAAEVAAARATTPTTGDDAPTTGLSVTALAALPAALRRRVLRRAALAAGVPPARLAAVHLAAMDSLVTAWHGQGPVALPGARRARRRCGTLLVEAGPRTPQTRPSQPGEPPGQPPGDPAG